MAYDWRNWIELARGELEQAREALAAGLYQMVAFFSHQIAEEALKGLWIVKGDGLPPRSHNLVELAEGLGAPEAIVSGCRGLNPLYTASRYPDVANGNPIENYDARIAGEALDLAESVFAWCLSQLPS